MESPRGGMCRGRNNPHLHHRLFSSLCGFRQTKQTEQWSWVFCVWEKNREVGECRLKPDHHRRALHQIKTSLPPPKWGCRHLTVTVQSMKVPPLYCPILSPLLNSNNLITPLSADLSLSLLLLLLQSYHSLFSFYYQISIIFYFIGYYFS